MVEMDEVRDFVRDDRAAHEIGRLDQPPVDPDAPFGPSNCPSAAGRATAEQRRRRGRRARNSTPDPRSSRRCASASSQRLQAARGRFSAGPPMRTASSASRGLRGCAGCQSIASSLAAIARRCRPGAGGCRWVSPRAGARATPVRARANTSASSVRPQRGSVMRTSLPSGASRIVSRRARGWRRIASGSSRPADAHRELLAGRAQPVDHGRFFGSQSTM